MGLNGISAGGALKAGPGLATQLEEVGTRDENANVLGLYLDNTSVEGGAPAPITENVGTISVSPTFVFNSNFTRERFGKAAVSNNVSLDSDRRSLLLDSNQTEADKALSFISALEFTNGLTAVQNMSDTDVTNRNQPDLDKFREYPESMFDNAALLNTAKETFVFDAVDASADATAAFTSYQ